MSLMDALLNEGYRDPREVWIAYRTDGVRGSGIQSDPFDGSTQVKFDALMNSSGEFTTIHLGPGTFETRGFSSAALNNQHPTWQPKKGMQIRGSGIDVTSLKLVSAGYYNGSHLQRGHYVAIGSEFENVVHGLEISDLTIDCNLSGQPHSPNLGYADLACGAIHVNGDHIRIRRVKAINWGTQTLPSPTDPDDGGSECFVIAAAGVAPDLLQNLNSESVEPIIQDCICVQPNESNARETSILHMGGSERDADHTMVFSRGPILRRNFVDCAFSGGRTSFILTIQSLFHYDGPPADDPLDYRIRTLRPHGRTVSHWVRISNVSPASSSWNGYYQVKEVIDDYTLKVTLPSTPTNNGVTRPILGTTFQALSMGLCRGGIVEDNRVFNTWTAGPYQDTYSTRDIVVRRNYYRNVATGHYYLMGGLSGTAGISVLTHSSKETESGSPKRAPVSTTDSSRSRTFRKQISSSTT